jgi:hypothetical protein
MAESGASRRPRSGLRSTGVAGLSPAPRLASGFRQQLQSALCPAGAERIVGDHKTSRTTQNQDRLFPIYRVQLNAYAYIARKLGWNPVSALALIYTEPVTTDEAAVEDAAQREDGLARQARSNAFRKSSRPISAWRQMVRRVEPLSVA